MSFQHRNSWVSGLSPNYAFLEDEVASLLLIEVVLVACLLLNEVLVYTLTEAISFPPRADVLAKAVAHRTDVFLDQVVSCPSGKTSLADERPQALQRAEMVVLQFHKVVAFDVVLESEIYDEM